jgi:hypothetical protein
MGLQLVVSLDTECDKGPEWRVRRPLAFRNVVEGVAERLQPLCERHGVRPTYLLSPEVMLHDASAAVFRGLGTRAELGTHLHAEFIEPDARLDTDRTSDFQCEYPPEVERAKLANLTALFEERFGYAPRSFRAGRYGIGPRTLTFLEELGYLVDSSVTPYQWWWRRRGEGVNFLGAPDQPYHPSASDFRRPGAMRILEVPITMANPFWGRWPRWFRLALNPLRRWQIVALNTIARRHLRCAWLRPTFATAEEMLALTGRLSARAGEADVVLCMMFHSNEVCAGTSPYNETDADVDRFLERIERYLDGLHGAGDVTSLGLSEVRAR